MTFIFIVFTEPLAHPIIYSRFENMRYKIHSLIVQHENFSVTIEGNNILIWCRFFIGILAVLFMHGGQLCCIFPSTLVLSTFLLIVLNEHYVFYIIVTILYIIVVYNMYYILRRLQRENVIIVDNICFFLGALFTLLSLFYIGSDNYFNLLLNMVRNHGHP